jgi:hypothetical protein
VRVTGEVGTRLANRYRLEECLERQGDASTWRALDEKLSRPVGVHMVPTDHDLAGAVVAAARSAAAVEDGRFLRVLDAVQKDSLVYVVSEWVPDARPLRELLSGGVLDSADAQLLATEAADAVASAHQHGLAHLCLDAESVLRTDGGQVKIVGLCVQAALRGTTAADPAQADVRALGRVLYAGLTGKWPDGPAYGLPAAPYEHGVLCTPRQVRAGVPQPLDDIADRALNPQPRHGPPLRTPAELAAALHELPRPRNPAGPYSLSDTGPLDATRIVPDLAPDRAPAPASDRAPGPPRRPSRAARGVQAAVLAVLGVGLVLLGWQILRASDLGGLGGLGGSSPSPSALTGPAKSLTLASVEDFDPPPGNGEEKSAQAPLAIDQDPETAWTTLRYNSAQLGRLKPGVGLVVDLGQPSQVREVRVQLVGDGTSLQIRAAGSDISSPPMTSDEYQLVAEKTNLDQAETIELSKAIRTRYVLVWLTRLPPDGSGRYRGGIAEVDVRG